MSHICTLIACFVLWILSAPHPKLILNLGGDCIFSISYNESHTNSTQNDPNPLALGAKVTLKEVILRSHINPPLGMGSKILYSQKGKCSKKFGWPKCWKRTTWHQSLIFTHIPHNPDFISYVKSAKVLRFIQLCSSSLAKHALLMRLIFSR